eukprot:GHVP01062227.1.p2 GENE.GHVP01062227.1~~GHVP01062227.1.p2  ORF type:complete len:130 (-),score=12.02 GHVP01062227.1:74-463(-)
METPLATATTVVTGASTLPHPEVVVENPSQLVVIEDGHERFDEPMEVPNPLHTHRGSVPPALPEVVVEIPEHQPTGRRTATNTSRRANQPQCNTYGSRSHSSESCFHFKQGTKCWLCRAPASNLVYQKA